MEEENKMTKRIKYRMACMFTYKEKVNSIGLCMCLRIDHKLSTFTKFWDPIIMNVIITRFL